MPYNAPQWPSHRSIFRLMLIATLLTASSASADTAAVLIGKNQMKLALDGFRFGFADASGKALAPMHTQTGLRIDGQAVVSTKVNPGRPGIYVVATETGLKAEVSVEASSGLVAITVVPEKKDACTIALSLGGMSVAYGLGDAGGWSGQLNLVRDKARTYKLLNNGGSERWQSSFVIFPHNQLAGVVLDGKNPKVTLGPDGYTMSVNAAEPATFHYFLGEVPGIYRKYRSLLTAKGYPQVKPKFRLFELGWESWAALGYQTRAETVLKSITNFQDHGYPIRWAVTGSGFWEEGGTTTSFGKFGEKFPAPSAFKQKMHERDVKWMIGLRTNFVLPGGPHIPATKKRDFNLKGKFFNGNPLSTVGVDKGYFLKDASGTLLKKTSPWFPIVPCYLLDGRNLEAVDWYAGLYRSWGIDGIKEDTMMNVGSGLLDIFNAPVSRLANDGTLVMARCGSFSSPGTLLRINDTQVKDMTKRTPINYLQYAASGAPNVYSDTVGFRKMKHYSEDVVRHGWLMALTAGLAVAENPFSWSPKQQALFKKPINFHYQIGPTLYDAAMKSYETGYPYTLTPLAIAYPEDENAAELAHYQWLAGESLLCAPLVKNHSSGTMDLYLPTGAWFDYDTGQKYQGPKLLKDFSMPVGKTPCFVGGTGILVTRASDNAPLQAHIYPVDTPPRSFTFHHPDGASISKLRLRKDSAPGIWSAATGRPVAHALSPTTGALSFELAPGESYEYALAMDSRSPARCEVMENERFRIEVRDSNTIVMREAATSSRTFTLDFVVLVNKQDPLLRLRPLSGGPRYTVSTWAAADPAKASPLKTASGPDHFAVGDGFDPSILTGGTKGRTADVFQAAPSFWISAKSYALTDHGLEFSFHDHPLFSLTARLTLEAGTAFPSLSFEFKPAQDGYYSVGYMGAPACSLAAADEIWQPLVWQEKRFPKRSHLTLAYRCPVPSAFVTENGVTTGVVADPKEYPFDPLPLSSNSRFGVAVRDVNGNARPMLFAPALGGLESKMGAERSYPFTMRLLTTAGDSMKAQEQVARDLYGFCDLRNNALGSLNRTVDNIADYVMSPFSLFREQNKGCNYSTDAPGAVKNVSSIDPLDLAIVMDDKPMFDRRAYPYMEYMLSRGKFLFTTDENQKTQFPSYRLDGPAAPISELAALHSMFHKATPLFKTLAEQELTRSRIRNLNVPEKGNTWWNALAVYRTTGEKRQLEAAIAGADRYIRKRVETAQTSFNDPDAAGGAMFWTGYAPRYIDLLMLFEATGEQRFLDAARTGARRYAQYVWTSPAVPPTDITVNKGGKAPEYWYLKGKGHKRVLLPEETVPAWRLSAMGLTAESSGTCSGHRAIFMANHAPWMLKIGHLAGDSFLMEIARSAVIGRYRNFPGYHINTARTTAYEKKDFPLCGHKDQSVCSFHYNHILPMLSMLMDYLVTDAFVRSDGQIDFPYNYSEGYAYMQNKAYGAMKGTFFGRDDALLWMPKKLIAVPDQINYIAARGERDLYVALMNESEQLIEAEILFDQTRLPAVHDAEYVVDVISGSDRTQATLSNGTLRVPVKGRGVTALIIQRLQVTPAFQNTIADLDESTAWARDLVELTGAPGKAMILNLGSASRFAYVFLEYSKHDYTKVELVYQTASGEKRAEDTEFPWEVTVPLDGESDKFAFVLNGYKPSGEVDVIRPEKDPQKVATETEPRKIQKRLLMVATAPILIPSAIATAAEINWAARSVVSASSYRDAYVPDKVKDRVVSDASRWLAAEHDKNPWLELAFSEPITVGMIDVFSGWNKGDSLQAFDVLLEVDGAWQRHADWEIRENTKTAKRVYIDRTNVSKIRLVHLKPTAGRIREIAVYDNKEAQGLKDVGEHGSDAEAYEISLSQHQIGLNQIGYLTKRPKRFTAPLSADGTAFKIRAQHQTAVLFSGAIQGGIGDFTDFKPADSDVRYVIDLEGGELKANTSDPFLVRKDLAREQYWQTAVDFLNDVRAVTGTHPSAYGGCAFRDSTYYDAIVPALVKFYLSDPQFINAMPVQIDWEADKARVTAPDFAFDAKNPCSGGVMDAVRNYYQLEPPKPDAPDVVKLIHWGAGYILMKPNGRDPSSSKDEVGSIEPQTVEQIAYVLWAWPTLKRWLPQSFYDQCRTFCFTYWGQSFKVSPLWSADTYTVIDDWRGKQMHPFKGRHAPGHSIVPNLLMHEVAKREKRSDADRYLRAAITQTEWIIQNLDWHNPLTTKGHRLSEHRTIPNLVWFLQSYPDQAPAGLKAKITEWAEVAVSRANNLWDFRRFSDELWTIPGMNEVGNSLSLPAIYTAASWVVDDPELKQRLEELALASIDHVFGRNPMLHAAPSHPQQGFPEIERGWPRRYKLDVCARLENVRGNIASMPGTGMYPFQPGTDFRHPEGWSNYGASWCISLAYLQFDTHGKTPQHGPR